MNQRCCVPVLFLFFFACWLPSSYLPSFRFNASPHAIPPPPPTSKKEMHKQTHYTNKRKDIYSQTSNDSSPHPQASFLSCAEEKGHYIQSTRFFFFFRALDFGLSFSSILLWLTHPYSSKLRLACSSFYCVYVCVSVLSFVHDG